MAGLFGDSWDDPKTQMILAMSAGLLGNRGNFAQGMSAALQGGLPAYQSAQKMQMLSAQQAAMEQDRLAQAEQRRAQVEAAQREAARQEQVRGYFGAIGQPVGLGAKVNPQPLEFSLPGLMRVGGTLDDAKKYLDVGQIGQPEYSNFRDVQTPEGPRVVGLGKRGESKVFPFAPVPKSPLVNVNTGKDPENKFTTKLQELQAARFDQASENAREAQEGNNALGRIKTVIDKGGVSGGPLAAQVVLVRNLASQVGLPIDKALDQRNAMFTAEFTSRLASKVLAGGRAITDNDARLIERAFPGFGSGIPSDQLPSFIAALEAINNEKIAYFAQLEKSVKPELRQQMPITFTNPANAGAAAAQPSPAAQIPAPAPRRAAPLELSVDAIMQELIGGQR